MSMENPFGSKNITDRCLRVEVDLLTQLNKMEVPHNGQPAKKKAGIKSAKQSVANIQHIRSQDQNRKRGSGELEGKENRGKENNAPSRELSRVDSNCRSRQEPSKRSSKKDELAYNQLLRKFTQAAKMTGCSRILSEEKLGEVLSCLSFVCLEQSQEDRQLLSLLYETLCKKQQGGVPQDDLFYFLVVLCNIQIPDLKTQESSCELSATGVSIWSAHQEERRALRRKFSKLHLNKISNDRSRRLSFHVEEPSFHPTILNNSRTMALSKRSKLLQEAKNTLHESSLDPLRASIDVADYLMINRRLSEKKLSQQKKATEQRQLDGCTFQPKVNRFDTMKTEESDPRKDRNQHLYESSKPQTSKTRDQKPTIERLELKQLEECTFKPTSTTYKKSKRQMTVRDQDKSVQRLKEAHEMRMVMKTLKERGYPGHIGNWQKFFTGYKKSTSGSSHLQEGRTSTQKDMWEPQHKKPIVSIDIRLRDCSDSLQVFDGDSIQSLTCKILVRHGLSYEYKDRVWKLIEATLQNNPSLIVFHDFVYEKR